MRRGDLYRVRGLRRDPKGVRVFVIASRQALLETSFSTVVCAPVYSSGHGIATQVPVGPEEGLKHLSWIFCDNLVSLPKADLTDYVGSLGFNKRDALNRALRIALDLA